MRHYLSTNKTLLMLTMCLLFAYGCSSSATGPDNQGVIDESGVKAELGDQTVLIPGHVIESGLRNAYEEKQTYTFDADVLSGAGLELERTGILLLEKKGSRIITYVSERDEKIYTYTYDADVLSGAGLEQERQGIQLMETKALRKITSIS